MPRVSEREASSKHPISPAANAMADDIGFTERGGYSLVHRTVFVYDALMAEEVLGALLRGGEVSYRRVARRAGKIGGYRLLGHRFAAGLAGAADRKARAGEGLHCADVRAEVRLGEPRRREWGGPRAIDTSSSRSLRSLPTRAALWIMSVGKPFRNRHSLSADETGRQSISRCVVSESN